MNTDAFCGGKITNYKDKIKNGKCEFLSFVEFDDDRNTIISNGSYCFIHIWINIKKIPFKIKFSNPGENIFSDDYYLHFKIKGKNNFQENWKLLDQNMPETKFFVTPFNHSQNDIDYKNITYQINGLQFFYINSDGNIIDSPIYNKKLEKKKKIFLFFKKILCSFCPLL